MLGSSSTTRILSILGLPGVVRRQLGREARELALMALAAERAAVVADDGEADGEPEPRAARVAPGGEEGVEDAFEVGQGDADAAVVELQEHALGAGPAR